MVKKLCLRSSPIFHTIQVEPILYMIYTAKSYLLYVYLLATALPLAAGLIYVTFFIVLTMLSFISLLLFIVSHLSRKNIVVLGGHVDQRKAISLELELN